MILSHSKMNLIQEDLYSYYLRYLCHVEPLTKSPALQIGEAVHYALEHETTDLNEFFKEKGSFMQQHEYSTEQLVAEALAEAYFSEKDEIFAKLLEGEEVVNVFKEQRIETPQTKEGHSFLGIIDLLIETKNGYIIVDYKTTSRTPNYEDYLDQLYRYCYLIHKTEPQKKILKLAIIGLRKPSIKQKRNEDLEMYRRRLNLEYKEKIDEYITYNIWDFNHELFNDVVLNRYYVNLEALMDVCFMLVNQGKFPVNYNKALTIYGKSQYYDFIYWNIDAIKANYRIADKKLSENNTIENSRFINNNDIEKILNFQPISTYSDYAALIKLFDKFTPEQIAEYGEIDNLLVTHEKQ